jgi:solute carrier family 35, member E3
MDVAAVLADEICLNNTGLRNIPIPFVQTVRSLTPISAAAVSTVALGKRLSMNAALVQIPVCLGLHLSTYEELSFHLGGFCSNLVSSSLTAIKLALSYVLWGDSLKLNPVAALHLMSPVSFLILAPIAYVLEGEEVLKWKTVHPIASTASLIVILSALSAFALNKSVFFLLKRTSAEAVSVARNFKVAGTVALYCLGPRYRIPVQLAAPWIYKDALHTD